MRDNDKYVLSNTSGMTLSYYNVNVNQRQFNYLIILIQLVYTPTTTIGNTHDALTLFY